MARRNMDDSLRVLERMLAATPDDTDIAGRLLRAAERAGDFRLARLATGVLERAGRYPLRDRFRRSMSDEALRAEEHFTYGLGSDAVREWLWDPSSGTALWDAFVWTGQPFSDYVTLGDGRAVALNDEAMVAIWERVAAGPVRFMLFRSRQERVAAGGPVHFWLFRSRLDYDTFVSDVETLPDGRRFVAEYRAQRPTRNSDERLRSTEREAATGDPQAAARLIVERLRVGQQWEVTSEDVLTLARAGMTERAAVALFRDYGLVRGLVQGPINEPDVLAAFRGLEVGTGAGLYMSGGRADASVYGAHVRSRDNTETMWSGETRPQIGVNRRRDIEAIRSAIRQPDAVPINVIQDVTENGPALVFWISYRLVGEQRVVGWVIVDRTNRILRLLQSGRSTTARSRATVQAVARRVGWSPVPGWLLDQPA